MFGVVQEDYESRPILLAFIYGRYYSNACKYQTPDIPMLASHRTHVLNRLEPELNGRRHGKPGMESSVNLAQAAQQRGARCGLDIRALQTSGAHTGN